MPQSFLTFLVDLASLDVRDPAEKTFLDFHFGLNNAPTPDWEAKLSLITKLQFRKKLKPGFFMIYTEQEKIFSPYPNNKMLKEFDVPYPMELHKSLIHTNEDYFIYPIHLNGRYIPVDTSFETLCGKIDHMVDKLHLSESYNERPDQNRVWFTDMFAYQVQHTLIFLRQSFSYIPPDFYLKA